MIPRRLLLLITILAMTAYGSAQEGAADSVTPLGVLDGATLSCSVAAPSWTTGCFVEKRMATLGPLEFAVGVDAQAVFSRDEYHLAPYAIVAAYFDTWSAWGEFALPDSTIPILGRPDYVRVGFSLTLSQPRKPPTPTPVGLDARELARQYEPLRTQEE